nr:glycosyltransferase [uncultured Psychroserpens sp.]
MSRKIKILFTIPNFDTAGSGKVVYDLVKGLNKELFAPEICCFHNKGDYFEIIKTLEVPIHLFEFATAYRPFFSLPLRVWRITKFLKKHKFDLIHSWHWSSDFTEPLAAKMAGIPFVYTKKAMGWGNKSWVWRSQLSNKIITINKEMLLFFEGMKDKIVPIPLGVDMNYYKPVPQTRTLPNNLQFSEKDFVIVSIANLAPVKGLETLFDAVRLLNDSEIKVLHIGASENDYGASLKMKYNQDQNIYFIGKKIDVRPYLAVADLFVIPTKDEGRREGLPIAPIEAMASGRIVIGSIVPGIKDILEEFPQCLFNSNDVNQLVSKIHEIRMMSLNDRNQLVINMREYVELTYSVNIFINKHESLYTKLVKK